MNNKLIIFSILFFSFLMIGSQVLASTSDGIIDSTYRYGWGENVGWVDFGSTAGAVHITDSTLSGYAYGENIGWIDLSNVKNTTEGVLSGYAWGENVGFIDFSKVTIGTDGVFTGGAYGENIGWITFGTTYNKVTTDWRPSSSSSRHTFTSTGSSAQSRYNNLLLMGNTKAAEELKKEFPNYITSSTISTPILNIPGKNITRTLKLAIPRMTGIDVKDLQTYLNTHGYDCGVTDGEFGPKTKAAVILFQKTNNLDPDGIVGPITREKMNQPQTPTSPINPNITRTLKLGTTGDDVKDLQTYLNTYLYNCGLADGIFGKLTKQAVILFQKANNLTPDGIVGPITRSKLN